MGMYDTVNGEQVKCFSWMSYCEDGLWEHGGDLKYYKTGEKVPYKKLHYNYGKNFIILDINKLPNSEYCNYNYVIHVIEDGRVANSFKNEIGKIDWNNNKSVVSYNGDLLNINSYDDIKNYIYAQRKYWKCMDKLNEKLNELFRKSVKYHKGINLLDKDSNERKERVKKIEEVNILMNKEEERIKPEKCKLTTEIYKWFNHDFDDLIILCKYLDSYYCALKLDKCKEANICTKKLSEILESDKTICDRYLKWQGINELKYNSP